MNSTVFTGICTRRQAIAAGFGAGLAVLPLGAVLRAQSAPRLADPVAFFTGRTRGSGTLTEAMSGPKPTLVTGIGRVLTDGTFVLDQVVDIEGKEQEERQWRLTRQTASLFTGSLSDARGKVSAEIEGARMTVRYTMKNRMGVHQVITFAADGRSATNRMRISRFGIQLATLEESIRKV